MKTIVLDIKDTINIKDLSGCEAIFVKKDDKLVGMVIRDDKTYHYGIIWGTVTRSSPFIHLEGLIRHFQSLDFTFHIED